MQRIQVIGGGFSGLCVAYFLARRGHKVRLVESSARCGGLLATRQTPYGPAETAANALLANRLVEEVAAEIGLDLVPTLPSARRRFIHRRGAPRRWPLGGRATLRFLGETMPRFFAARASFRPRPGESVRAWGHRCLGAEATDYLLVPALSGVYAGDAEQLSASLLLGRFFSGGPRPSRGKLRGSVAPLLGMEEWPKAFRRALEAKGAEFASTAEEGLETIVALPPPAAASFLKERAPGLALQLARIEMLPLVSVTLFLPEDAPGLEGFGCLFPRAEGFRVLGLLANDRIFPGRARNGARSETWILGGATDPGAVQLPNEDLLALLTEERRRIFGSSAPHLHAELSHWPAAIPHYNLTLERTLAELGEGRENRYTLFGTYLGDLGLARVLVRAENLARRYS